MQAEWKVICYLAELFASNDIKYQFDGSTAVFIHGVKFVMDDLDVYICNDMKEKGLYLLRQYVSSELKKTGTMEYCFIKVDGVLVHALFDYEKTDFMEETRDIVYNGVKIHTKNIEFYRNNTRKDNPLIPLIDEWLTKNK